MRRGYRPPVTQEDRILAQLAVSTVTASTGVWLDFSARRCRLQGRGSKARWMAMYLSHVTFGWTLERVGDVFGLNRSTAVKACRWVEDARDRPDVDDALGGLEEGLRALIGVRGAGVLA